MSLEALSFTLRRGRGRGDTSPDGCRKDDRARLLGVEVLLQLGRALDVAEQRAVTVLRSPWRVSGAGASATRI
jgi:hypothetical protein